MRIASQTFKLNFFFIILKTIYLSFLSSPNNIELNRNGKRKLALVASIAFQSSVLKFMKIGNGIEIKTTIDNFKTILYINSLRENFTKALVKKIIATMRTMLTLMQVMGTVVGEKPNLKKIYTKIMVNVVKMLSTIKNSLIFPEAIMDEWHEKKNTHKHQSITLIWQKITA